MPENLFYSLECGVELTAIIRDAQETINATSVFFQSEIAMRPDVGFALRIKNGKHDRVLISIRNEGESIFVRAVEKRGDLRIKTPWALFQKRDEQGNQLPNAAAEVATYFFGTLNHLRDTTDSKLAQSINRAIAPVMSKVLLKYMMDQKKASTPSN